MPWPLFAGACLLVAAGLYGIERTATRNSLPDSRVTASRDTATLVLAALMVLYLGSEFDWAYTSHDSPIGPHGNPHDVTVAVVAIILLAFASRGIGWAGVPLAGLVGPTLLAVWVCAVVATTGTPGWGRALLIVATAMTAWAIRGVAAMQFPAGRRATVLLLFILLVTTAGWTIVSLLTGVTAGPTRFTLLGRGQTGAGVLLGAMTVTAAALVWTRGELDRRWRHVTVVCGLVVYVGLVMNVTRAAILATALATAYVVAATAWLERGVSRATIARVSVWGVGTMGALLYTGTARSSPTSLGTTVWRVDGWRVLVEPGVPIFGEGFTSSSDRAIGVLPDGMVGNAHNSLLEGALSFGLVWPAVVLACAGLAWHHTAHPTLVRPILIVLFLATVTDSTLGRDSSALVLLLALVGAERDLATGTSGSLTIARGERPAVPGRSGRGQIRASAAREADTE